jgi:hypothetical protein
MGNLNDPRQLALSVVTPIAVYRLGVACGGMRFAFPPYETTSPNTQSGIMDENGTGMSNGDKANYSKSSAAELTADLQSSKRHLAFVI